MESSCSVILKPCNTAVITWKEPPDAKTRAPCPPHSGHTA